MLDEAQDILEPSVLNCLDLVLEGGFSKGKWLICLDEDVQAGVYGRMSRELLDI